MKRRQRKPSVGAIVNMVATAVAFSSYFLSTGQKIWQANRFQSDHTAKRRDEFAL